MQAQLCCHGIDDGRMVVVPDPAPDIFRVPRPNAQAIISNPETPDAGIWYDEYRRDGITNAGLIRYVRIEK